MLYKATENFKKLGIDNSYQGLNTDDYYNLLHGNKIELINPPKFLIENKYIEQEKEVVKKNKDIKGGL